MTYTEEDVQNAFLSARPCTEKPIPKNIIERIKWWIWPYTKPLYIPQEIIDLTIKHPNFFKDIIDKEKTND